MANESVKGSLSFKILPEELRKRFKGSLSYNGADSTELWVYKKLQVTHTNADIFSTGDEFLGISSSDAVALTDTTRFVVIKHTGFTDTNENLETSNGVLLSICAGTQVYNGRGDATVSIFLGPKDSIALKVPYAQAGDWHARSCTISNGIPAANGSSGDNVLIEVAAILDNV